MLSGQYTCQLAASLNTGKIRSELAATAVGCSKPAGAHSGGTTTTPPLPKSQPRPDQNIAKRQRRQHLQIVVQSIGKSLCSSLRVSQYRYYKIWDYRFVMSDCQISSRQVLPPLQVCFLFAYGISSDISL